MNMKNSIKKVAGLATLVGLMTLNSCETSTLQSRDTVYKPYTPISFDAIPYQQPGSRVIVQGDIKNVEDGRIILESKLQVSSILLNDYSTSGAIHPDGTTTAELFSEVAWDSIAPIFRNHIKNTSDTTNIYSSNVKIYGVVNKDKMLEMRFIEMDGKLYDAFK